MSKSAELKNAEALEAMMATEGWKVFVDSAVDLRAAWVNDLVYEEDDKKKIILQAQIMALDGFIQNPSEIVEALKNSRS